MYEEITDQQRFPLLKAEGRRMLDRLRQHPHAPRYNYHCGEKLSAAGLQRVRDFAQRLRESPSTWSLETYPPWLPEYVRICQQTVPYYRRRDADLLRERRGASDFRDLPFTDRGDLRREPWNFVPDTADISDLIVYSTSGTTGNLVRVICHPAAPACYLPLFETALSAHGVSMEGGSRVSIIHVAAQESTYTLTSVMSYFDFAGFAKINLNPREWNTPGDREAFLDDCAAEIYTGDPFALVELSKLHLKTRPKAIISSATTLLPAVRDKLEQHFTCPVIDMISMNESGPIAFSQSERHRVFPHHIYLEIVDDQGRVLPCGEFGEIVLTGGINPHLPLLRYRTGDYGALEFAGDQPALAKYSGRAPVHFFRANGAIVRSIDVVVALFKVPLPVFRLHQQANGKLIFQTRCDQEFQREVRQRLMALFGDDAALDIEQMPDDRAWRGKALQFTSDYEQPDS